MANTKKSGASSTTKKPSKNTSTKSQSKKTNAKKMNRPAPVKRTTTKVSRKKAPSMKSFHITKQDEPFMTARVTLQTVYWSILSVIVLLFGLWIIDINDQISRIQDQIDAGIVQQTVLGEKEVSLLRSKMKPNN